MRTSLIEIQEIEKWQLELGDPSERLVTDAKMQIDPALREKATWQRKSYALIQMYGRKKLRNEIRSVEKQLFHSSKHRSFQQKILSIFNR